MDINLLDKRSRDRLRLRDRNFNTGHKFLFYFIQESIFFFSVTSVVSIKPDISIWRQGNNLFQQRDRWSPAGRVNSPSNSPWRRHPRETAALRRPATNSQLPRTPGGIATSSPDDADTKDGAFLRHEEEQRRSGRARAH